MDIASSGLEIDPDLIRRYDVSGPRYTSYPTADRFVGAFGEGTYSQWLGLCGQGGDNRPLSLYLHIPFCSTICFYCGCNKIVTRDRSKSEKYVRYLRREIGLVASRLKGGRVISQMHWGGGTPTFLAREQMGDLVESIEARFERAAGFEYSIEVDPRAVEPGMMNFLASLGFNRVSVGVQDFDAQVQRAVHRVQSEEETRRVVEEARSAGFKSVNLDLIYGLPKQTAASFARTLEQVIELDPDRLSLYSYAHLPRRFMPQKRIDAADLPAAQEKLRILTLAIERLAQAGYTYIGMDHFAKPGDDLAVAQREGRLQRNFQGYSTFAGCDMIGLGVSAIGRVGATYSQNRKDLDGYYAALERGELPVTAGLVLTRDDQLRREVIQMLACHFQLSITSLESEWQLDFRDYFSVEWSELMQLERDGLIELRPDAIAVTAKGRLLVRIVCMVFDRHLRVAQRQASYSKVM